GHGAIRLTTARYYTPSGRSIQAMGIDPDIVVEPARIEIIAQPKQRGEADLRGALEGEETAPAPATSETPAAPNSEVAPDGEPAPDGEAPAAAQDYQLARALDLLRGLALFNARTVN
ncbi:MAG: S41 family peptidase, partial [Dongiaceae bacterium]